MNRLSLRFRISSAISIVCVVIVSALGSAFYAASEQMELLLVEQLVGEELEFLIRRHEIDPELALTPGPNVEYYILKVGDERAEIPAFLKNIPDGHHEIDIGNNLGERDVIIQQIGNLRYVVVYNIGPYEEREHEFQRLVMGALIAVVLLSIGMGYLLSGYLTRQIRSLAGRVSKLVPGEVYDSLQNKDQDREIALLANTFDQYHQLFMDMITREQEFTANVSHELRTPLTAIRTSSELLLQDDGLSEKSKLRAQHILTSVCDTAEHVNALLMLARQQSVGAHEELELRECIEDVLVPFRDEISRKELSCEIDVPFDAVVFVNRQALQIVLGNLIKNAVSYTFSGYIRLSFHKDTIDVADSGRGIPAGDLPFIFSRHYKSSKSEGLGLGLDIVKRICDREKWGIQVISRINSGTLFRLVLSRSE